MPERLAIYRDKRLNSLGRRGESTLVDDLLTLGYLNISVLDISHEAIQAMFLRSFLSEAGKRTCHLVQFF